MKQKGMDANNKKEIILQKISSQWMILKKIH